MYIYIHTHIIHSMNPEHRCDLGEVRVGGGLLPPFASLNILSTYKLFLAVELKTGK